MGQYQEYQDVDENKDYEFDEDKENTEIYYDILIMNEEKAKSRIEPIIELAFSSFMINL